MTSEQTGGHERHRTISGSEDLIIPKRRTSSESNNLKPKVPTGNFLVPSPVPCRRTRSTSISLLAADSPIQTGTITEFNRGKGHGFVKPDGEEKPVFLHISDIEDEYVVHQGDRVEFKTIPMPPKMEQKMAVEVHLIDVDMKVPHERWDSKPDIRL